MYKVLEVYKLDQLERDKRAAALSVLLPFQRFLGSCIRSDRFKISKIGEIGEIGKISEIRPSQRVISKFLRNY